MKKLERVRKGTMTWIEAPSPPAYKAETPVVVNLQWFINGSKEDGGTLDIAVVPETRVVLTAAVTDT